MLTESLLHVRHVLDTRHIAANKVYKLPALMEPTARRDVSKRKHINK